MNAMKILWFVVPRLSASTLLEAMNVLVKPDLCIQTMKKIQVETALMLTNARLKPSFPCFVDIMLPAGTLKVPLSVTVFQVTSRVPDSVMPQPIMCDHLVLPFGKHRLKISQAKKSFERTVTIQPIFLEIWNLGTGMQRLEKNQLLASVGDMAWVRGTRQVKKQDRVNKYSLNEIPERYSIEVKNSFAALDLTERKPDELWQEGENKRRFQKDRDITGEFKPRVGSLKSNAGGDLCEESLVKERWRVYTEDLYRSDHNIPQFTEGIYEEEAPIIEEEVRKAVKSLANGKSPGSDELPIELFKEVGEEGVIVLTVICQRIWCTGVWPKRWKESIYIPIPKKGDPRICSNNRTIALISHASKVMLKVIQYRLEGYMEREMSIEQAGFRKGRGTRDQIANLRWILERSREFQRPVYMCFIDYSKAFDCVDHPTLWTMLTEMGIPKHLVHVIKSLYNEQEAKVRTEYGDTENFNIGKGVRQGCILSPYLFNLYSEYIMRQANLDNVELGVKIGGRRVNNLRYADDTTLLAESKEDLLNLMERVQTHSPQAGLHLNLKKTKVMCTEELDEIIWWKQS
ncbi:hypothetical protein BSL78_28030 [Apostichopus japonicus]|uniref:Reverse transcriptase domain-containing protein n=1 Tax=Stichopus japonicus TaxID=307972 RepID=A0A2G8JHE9_STIJA|nr:hypothetical protein BSL78_28030 [Apostichopus japonicus]